MRKHKCIRHNIALLVLDGKISCTMCDKEERNSGDISPIAPVANRCSYPKCKCEMSVITTDVYCRAVGKWVLTRNVS